LDKESLTLSKKITYFMENWLKNILIKNFKSIQEVTLSECERINLFVGRPNVGKSNLLEALGLLSPFFFDLGKTFAKGFVRYERVADLFFDQNYLTHAIEIGSDNHLGRVELSHNHGQFLFKYIQGSQTSFAVNISADGSTSNVIAPGTDKIQVIKRYQFPETQIFLDNRPSTFLTPPYGENLLSILQTNKNIRLEASKIFEEYQLELLVDSQSARLEIAKKRDGILFKTPFSLVADTLRRYLFHLAAIESNRDSVLLFEEPESHNFPPYIQLLAQRIMEEKTNQYFITTHSPFLFNSLVEGAKDVAVFVVEYENFQTKIRRLTEDNLKEVLDYGLNIFTEQELFAQ